jgi:hypothetical protein
VRYMSLTKESNTWECEVQNVHKLNSKARDQPIPVAARSNAWVYGRSLAGIAGSNPTGGMDVCVVFVVRTVAWNVK